MQKNIEGKQKDKTAENFDAVRERERERERESYTLVTKSGVLFNNLEHRAFKKILKLYFAKSTANLSDYKFVENVKKYRIIEINDSS